jgi:hypothetical protein
VPGRPMKTAVVDLQYKKNNKYMKKKAFCLFPKKNKINNIWAIHFCKKIEKIIGTSMYPRAKFKKKKKKSKEEKSAFVPKKAVQGPYDFLAPIFI